ncbi:hypothetical protein DRN62_00620 [Nanoarchaeota archaeon]|nr:MAG: hypothetical protein DRN62_00620 [Nanoarchaeota archaeon]
MINVKNDKNYERFTIVDAKKEWGSVLLELRGEENILGRKVPYKRIVRLGEGEVGVSEEKLVGREMYLLKEKELWKGIKDVEGLKESPYFDELGLLKVPRAVIEGEIYLKQVDVIGDLPAQKLPFEMKKEFWGTHGFDRKLPWREAPIDKGIEEVVKKVNSLPFAYTSGSSCSGLPEDHEEEVPPWGPHITMSLDPKKQASFSMLEEILETGFFEPEVDGRVRLRMFLPKSLEKEEVGAYIEIGWGKLEAVVQKFLER